MRAGEGELVGIDLVPVTVLRTVDGQEGSVQFWIEDVTTMERALESHGDAPIENFDLLLQRLMLTYILDALIYNVDRNPTNVLVGKEDPDVFHPIDHSRAFRPSPDLPGETGGAGAPIPARVAAALRTFDLADLEAILLKSVHGAPVFLRDVAEVRRGYLEPSRQILRYDGTAWRAMTSGTS